MMIFPATSSLKDYLFYGSNDNSTWQQLVSVINKPYDANNYTVNFSNNTKSYRYYKLNITLVNGASIVSVGDIYIWGYDTYNNISLNSPGNISQINHTVIFNCSSNVSDTTLTNISLWTNYTGVWQLEETQEKTGTTNTSIFTKTLPDKLTIWNCQSCENNGNCKFSPSNYSINITGIIENTQTYNSSSYKTKQETFNLNISTNGTSTPVVYLVYNGTSYLSTLSSGLYTKTMSLPTVGNISFYWRIEYGGETYYTSTNYQNVLDIEFAQCNSTLSSRFLNISFRDESNLSSINASIPSSSFVYYLGDGLVNKTYTFLNNSANAYYLFCFSVNQTLYVEPTVQYENTLAPQRIWQPTVQTYTNTTTNQILYLLTSSGGIYVTFQVLGGSGVPLSGVDISAFREISGTDVEVGNGITDSAGLLTLWLNPNFEHTISFVKSSYDSYNFTTFPTQTSYTINLGGGSFIQPTDYTKGITTIIRPTNDFLSMNTVYNINFTISTNYWTLDEFGYSIYYYNGTLIDSQNSIVDTGDTLNSLVNTSNQTKIIMNYYYIVNGSQINGTRYWLTQNENDFSIWHFFTDLSLYIDQDIFGIKGDDDGVFSKALISVVILISVVGVLGYRYGLVSEPAIMGIIFGVLLLLNTLNFIPNPDFLTNSAVTLGDFIVFVCVLLMVSFIFKEEAR